MCVQRETAHARQMPNTSAASAFGDAPSFGTRYENVSYSGAKDGRRTLVEIGRYRSYRDAVRGKLHEAAMQNLRQRD